MYCLRCGSRIEGNNSFCISCGVQTPEYQTPVSNNPASNAYQSRNDKAYQAYPPYNDFTPAYRSRSNQVYQADTKSGGFGTAAKKLNPKHVGMITCAVLVFIAIIGISAIFNGGKGGGIVGTWVNDSGETCFVFNKDGSCQTTLNQDSVICDSINYKITGNGTIIFSDIYGHPCEPIPYRINGNKLYLTGRTEYSRYSNEIGEIIYKRK